MSTQIRSLAYNYIKRIRYNITFNYYNASIAPAITGGSYVYTNDTTVFNVDTTDFDVDSITTTNATGVYDSTNKTITITNVTGDVIVLVKGMGIAAGSLNNYWTLYIGGTHAGASLQIPERGACPSGGTVSYTDIYGDSKTLDLSTLGMVPTANQNWYMPNYSGVGDKIMAGTSVTFSNITVTRLNAGGTIRIGYRDTSDHTLSEGPASYTVPATYVTPSNSIFLRTLLD